LTSNNTVVQRLPFIRNYERILAAGPSDSKLVKLLRNAGTNVNAQSNNDLTALMIASHESNTKMVKLLLAAGADVNLRGRRGRDVIRIARTNIKDDTVTLLEAHARCLNANN
jgi:ankyrin repeat protein